MSENVIFEIIRALVKASLDDKLESTFGTSKYELKNAHYLLGQVLRQIEIPLERRFVSNAAKQLWEQLGMNVKDIHNFKWKDKIISKNDNIIVYEYVGASKSPKDENGRQLNKCDSFEYRSVFHDEHIIPIKVIIEELQKSAIDNKLTDERIQELIDTICICKITKQEDRSINKKYNRPSDLLECYQNVYKGNSDKKILIDALEEKINQN